MAELQPRQAALTELDALLALADVSQLDRRGCARVAALLALVPGRTRRVVDVLGRQRDAAAVDALVELPRGTVGVVEAVYAALRQGVSRRRDDGHEFPRMLALEFRSSAARRFPLLVERASAAFGSGLERLRVDGKLHYRFALFESRPPQPSLRERALPVELDVVGLHEDLERLRGVRLWLNGWCFDDGAQLAARSRGALIRAWFDWAVNRG